MFDAAVAVVEDVEATVEVNQYTTASSRPSPGAGVGIAGNMLAGCI